MLLASSRVLSAVATKRLEKQEMWDPDHHLALLQDVSAEELAEVGPGATMKGTQAPVPSTELLNMVL